MDSRLRTYGTTFFCDRSSHNPILEAFARFVGLGAQKAAITVIDMVRTIDVRPTVTAQIGRLALSSTTGTHSTRVPILLVRGSACLHHD